MGSSGPQGCSRIINLNLLLPNELADLLPPSLGVAMHGARWGKGRAGLCVLS